MATEIDKRVVEMRFDNKDFEKNCKQSLTTLEKLKMALNFDGAKGLESVGKAANKLDLSNLSKGAERVQVSFSAMQVAGMTAIQELTKGVINFGKNVWANTFGQIKTGGWARSLKIDQANFQMKALAENLDAVKNGTIDVTQYMNKMSESIDKAVTGTAYGYDAAAAVASQLMSSSITDVNKMYDHLRAIAGAAAMTGSSFEEIGHIFTRVASNGRVMGDDLQSFSSRGLNLTAALGKALGKTEAEIRDMVSKGKISFMEFSDALSNAFGEAAGKADETWSGVTSNVKAQLSRIGQLFTDPMIKNFIPVLAEVKARLKDINKALQPVAKTWTKFIEYISDKSKLIVKNLKADALKSVIHSIENVLVALIEIIWTIGRAVREVFPKEVQTEFKTGLRTLETFTRTLIPSQETLYNFRQIVKAILIPFKALWTIGVAVLKYAIGPLLQVFVKFVSILMKVGKAFRPIIDALISFVTNGEFLSNVIQIIVNTLVTLSDILITILDCVIRVVETLTQSGTFNLILNFLSLTATLLGDVIVGALEIVFGLINAILSVINPDRIESFFSVIIDVLNLALGMLLSMYVTFVEWLDKMSQGDTIFGKILLFLRETWELIKNFFSGNDISGNLTKLQNILEQLGEKIKAAWEKFKEFLHGMDAGKIIVYAFALSMVLLILSIRGFFNALTDAVKNVSGGIKELVGIFSDIRGFLSGMLKMTPALQVMLGLIGLMWSFTACFVILSDLQWDQIARAGVALGGFGAGLLILVLVLSKIKFAGFSTALSILPAIMGLAIAICASAAAIVMLSRADITLKRLIPALISVALLLGLLGGAMVLIQLTAAKINTIVTKRMAAEEKRVMVSAGVVIAFAAAVAVLTIALIKVSELPFKQAMRGLAAVAGLMLALSVSMAIINWSGAKFGSALGIALFIGSFILLLKSIVALADLPFETMVQGLKNAGSVLSMIAIFFTLTGIIGKKIGNVAIHNITSMFSSLAILIAVTTATIFLLQGMTSEAIAKGIGVIILISALFTAVVKYLLKSLNSFAGNMKTYKDASILKSFSKFLITFSVCISLLAVAAMLAQKVEYNGIAKIGMIMAVLTTCLWFMERAAAHTKRAKIGVIITFILGLTMVLSMLAVLTLAAENNPDGLMNAAMATVGVILALSVLAAAMSLAGEKVEKAAKEGKEGKFKNAMFFVAMIMGLIGVLAALVPLTKQFKDADAEKLTAAGIAIGIVLVALTAVVATFAFAADRLKNADNLPKLAAPILAMGVAMIMLIHAFVEILSYITDGEQAIFGLTAIATILITFFVFINNFQDILSTASARDVTPARMYALGVSVMMVGSVFLMIAAAIKLMSANIVDEYSLIGIFTSFLMILSMFIVVCGEFKSLIEAMDNAGLESSDMLKTASSVVILTSVLGIIAGTIVGMAAAIKIFNNPLETFLVYIGLMAGLVGVCHALKSLVKLLSDKITSSDLLKVATSIVILSSVLAIIAATVTELAYVTKNTGWLNVIIASAAILGGFAVIVGMFDEFMDRVKDIKIGNLLAVAGIINLVSLALVIISYSITKLASIGVNNADAWTSMLAAWGFIISAFVIVLVALHHLTKYNTDFKKLLAVAGAIDIACLALAMIAESIYKLKDANVDQDFGNKLMALLGPLAMIELFLLAVGLLGNNIHPESMLAAAAAIVVASIALFTIGDAVAKMVTAFKGVKFAEIEALKKIMNHIIGLLAIIAVLGTIGGVGGMVGWAAIAGIAALAGVFVIFAAGVKVLAKAADIFVDAILKINGVKLDYHTIHKNMSAGLRGASDAIVDAYPNMVEALRSLFMVVLAAIEGVVGTVVSVGMAFMLAFMDGILMALPEALNILSQIMKIIVDWLEQPGQFDLIRSFFKDIGKLLVEVLIGAIEGVFDHLTSAFDDWCTKAMDKENELKREQAKNQFSAEANEKIFNKAFNQTGVGPNSNMFSLVQSMRAQQEYLDTLQKESQSYKNAYYWFDDIRSQVFENLDKMTYQDWTHTIDYLNQYAENVRNAGGVLDEEFLKTAQYLQHVAPMEFRDRFNDALLGIEPTVEEVEAKVEELNATIAAGPESDIYGSFEEQVMGAADATHDLKKETEFVNAELEKTGGAAVTLDTLKSKFSSLTDSAKNAIKNIDIKGAAKKLGVDATKLGATLGKITGISFGEEYADTREAYEAKAYEKVYNQNGQWQYYYQTMGYESGEAYVEGMMAATDDGYTYAAKRLFEFLGINIDVEDALGDATDAAFDFGSSLTSIGDSADDTKDKLTEFRDNLKDSIANAMHGIFDEVKEQEYIDPEEMLYRMSENVRRVGEWARNIATLAARGMSEGLLNELKNMGPEGAAKVQAFVDMTDEQLQMANRRWKAAEFMPDYGTKEIEQAYRDAGFNASLGFANGIVQDAADTNMKKMGNNALDALMSDECLDESSPSHKTEQMGVWATEGFAIGLTNSQSQMLLRQHTHKLAGMIFSGMKSEIQPQQFQQLAYNAFDGFSNGMANRIPQILSKVTSFCSQLIATFMRVLRMHSPSKAMEELGDNAMAGFGIGVEEGADNVEKMTDQTANDILNQMKANIAAVTNGWSEENVYQPVIRPVFDMESINQGYTDIQSWFANAQGINLNGNLSRLTPTSRDDDASTQQIINAINGINNDDVVREIGALRSDISQLQSAITSMQVVMNTGVLVGQLVEPMDKALGAKALYNSRGRY